MSHPCSLLSASTLGLTAVVTPLRARPPVGLRCHIGHLAEAQLDPPRRTRCTCRLHWACVVGVGHLPGSKNAGGAFPVPGVWPCPLLRQRECALRVVLAGAHPMETAAPSPLGAGGHEATELGRGGGFWQEAMVLCSRLQLAAPTGRSPFAALPSPFLQ